MLKTVLRTGFALGMVLSFSACDKAQLPAQDKSNSGQEPYVDQTLIKETQAFVHADIIYHTREGKVLTLFEEGVAIARFTDTNGDTWRFIDGFAARDGAKYFIFHLLTQTDADIISYVFDGKGRLVEFNSELNIVNTEAGLLATGQSYSMDSHAHLVIKDWSKTPHQQYVFESLCYPVAWLDAKELKAKCLFTDEPENEQTEALVSKLPNGKWHLKELSLPKVSRTGDPKIPDKLWDETVSATPVPLVDAEGLKYATDRGYQRLTKD